MDDSPLPDRIAHYRIERALGSGGMGTVVAAHDERLDRPVAIKILHRDVTSGTGVRLWREARAAAAVRHPAVCQVFDVGEDREHLYIAMELLDGETLAARLARGPLTVVEAMDVALALLDAIAAIHARGLLHRDLKPANLMLTSHGLKVLDFGLARAPIRAADAATTGDVTLDGMLLGTPAYIAPEVLNGATPDARADLFAVGAVLFEMLSARPAFQGATPLLVAHAVLHDQPPALSGGPSVAALDRVLRQALNKDPARRFDSAAAMAAAVRNIRRPGTTTPVTARATRRVIVLPFRALRRDDDTEFLCASLPEAVTATLSQLDSLVVRSSLVGGRFGPSPDLDRLASEADVDVALTGTLFPVGGEIRMNAQLVEVPGGAVLRSSTYQAAARNVVDLHDSIVRNIVDGLADQLTAGEQSRLERNSPASQTAYALFLRGNELARDRRRLADAVVRYRESLAIDSTYAPGWAQLARAYRLSSKYESSPADHLQLAREALERALALDPELDLAHSVYAQLEADIGQSRAAMLRLTRRAMRRGGAAEIYASLVYACRFCGLASESITFHHEAKRLDPATLTSVTQSYFQTGDYLRCLETAGDDLGYIGPAALDALGQRGDAIDELRTRLERGMPLSGGRLLVESLLATLLNDRRACLELVRRFLSEGYIGGEAKAYIARQLVYLGEHDAGLEHLARSVDAGFHHARWLESDAWFDAVRTSALFASIMDKARHESDLSRAAFEAAGGSDLLARPSS
jgi:serine/threonine protein kinase/tetratricopeptide (TPR) repeat protein